MNKMTRMAIPVLAVLLLAACGGSEGSPLADAGTDVVEDMAMPDEQTLDEQGEDELTPPPREVTPQDLGPAAGTACDDGNPCTHGEVILVDGACGGGTPYTCDDGRECTDDQCNGTGDCLFTVSQGHCLVAGTCMAAGDTLAGGCLVCDPDTSPTEATALPDGEACDDGDGCTDGDQCTLGECVGEPLACVDDNPCTADSCNPAEGCVFAPLDGVPCPAADACSEPGLCVEGECQGASISMCDDGNPCTQDGCDEEEGCTHEPLADGEPCDDGDPCATGDTCQEGQCSAGPELLSCEDGNECTADLCHPVSGCYHELNDNPCCDDQGVNACDDGNWCTTDSCDPETGECFYDFNDLACNDGDPCTGPDQCLGGTCGGPPVDCDDGNPCTEDSCDPQAGCVHTPLDGVPCDDGLECSTGDACVAGECVADMSGCACQPAFGAPVNKINALTIGQDGQPGNGADVDLDPATCAPAGSCSEGIDNSLSMLAGFANDPLQDALAGGSVILLFEHRNFVADGSAYTLALYIGSAADDNCDGQTEECDYLVNGASFDEDCQPLVTMDNATMDGTDFFAGGPGYNFVFPLPLAEGVLLEVVLYNAQVIADATLEGGGPATLDGVLGGAIAKEDIIAGIDQVPADQLPLDKEMIISLIDMMVTNDIDTDNDGSPDAASVGLPFGAITGTIVGVEE